MDYNSLLNDIEAQRKTITKRIFHSFGMVIVLMLLGLLITQDIAGLSIGGIFGLVVSVAYVTSSAGKYKKAFKNQFMPLLIAKTGLDLKYDYKDGVGENTVMGSKLFKRPDKYHCEDLMYGTIEDIRFMASDVHMLERNMTMDGKGRRQTEYVTFFKGRWFVYDFNKEFNGIIQVRESGFLEKHPWGLNVRKISLEDVEFNKKFKTYASNQHDAFYVLTPHLMENMKKLEKRYSGKIYFSFIGSMLHIAIYDSRDSFEPPIFSPINDAFVSSQVQDIMILQDIINELKLNRNIFKQ